jgi:osmotically-inducible protein OsmY
VSAISDDRLDFCGARHVFAGQGDVFLEMKIDKNTHLRADQIVEEAKHRLQQRPHLTVQRIWCEFTAGKLFLRGQVPSFYHKQLAQTAVAAVDGVDQVVNDIEVVW